MNSTLILLNVIFLLVCLVFLLLLKIKCIKSRKISNDLIGFISRSSEILSKYEKNQEIIQLRNSIKLYSLIRIMINIIKPDYVSFFKYVYNKKELNFIFSVDNDGIVLQKSYLEKISVFSSILNSLTLKNTENDINCIYSDNIENKSDEFYQILVKNDIDKVYYKYIYNSKEEPIGLVILSYKDESYVLSDDDKNDILKIIEESKHII